MNNNTSNIWLPDIVGKGYKDYWHFQGRFRVCKGSRASKKSKTTALNFIWRIIKYPKSNLLVVRKTYRTLRDSCYAEFKWAIERFGVSRFFECRVSPLEITYLPTGQKIYFRGLDDPFKITSIAVSEGVLCWLWIEEAYEIEKEEDFDILQESIRGQVPKGLFKQITLTFNPWNEHHWIKKRFFDIEKDSDVFAITTNYKINEWLDEADKKMFETMKIQNPKRYMVAGEGHWGVAEGLVYNFDEARHIDDTIPEHGEYYLSIDYGTVNPFACYLWCVTDKVAYCLDEYYYDSKKHDYKRTDEEHYEAIKELAKGYNIEAIVIDPSAASFKATIERHDKFDIINAKNDVINGINNMISIMDTEYIKFNSRCVNLFKEFKKYSWDKEAKKEAIIKEHDHCLTGDTLVHTDKGEIPIKDLVDTIGKVWSYNEETKRAELRSYFDVRQTRDKAQIYKIETEDGRVIRCTGEHPILTNKGWAEAKDINLSSKILDILKDKHIQIKSIKMDNLEPVYNMEVEYNHNFAINGGLIVHNCMDSSRYFVNTILLNEFDHLDWGKQR